MLATWVVSMTHVVAQNKAHSRNSLSQNCANSAVLLVAYITDQLIKQMTSPKPA